MAAWLSCRAAAACNLSMLCCPPPHRLHVSCSPCTALPSLLQYERRDQFDRIVIETTGLAQPAPIIQTFFLEPKVADRMKLDGVVTLVRRPAACLQLSCVPLPWLVGPGGRAGRMKLDGVVTLVSSPRAGGRA